MSDETKTMYQDWRIKRWDSPISDTRAIAMVSLIDTQQRLEIIVEAYRLPNRPRWKFTFSKYPAYRNILEEHRLTLWNHLKETNQFCGHTFIIEESPWIASFEPEEPLLALNYKMLRHFVISTDDVIDVLSNAEPKIESIEPASTDAPEPGKSQNLYLPADKDKVDDLIEKIKGRQKSLTPEK
jgi:hypothetical protein